MPSSFVIEDSGERKIALRIPGLLLPLAQAEELVQSLQESLRTALSDEPLPVLERKWVNDHEPDHIKKNKEKFMTEAEQLELVL